MQCGAFLKYCSQQALQGLSVHGTTETEAQLSCNAEGDAMRRL